MSKCWRRNNRQNCELHAAAEAGADDAALQLINSGTNINLRNSYGETALVFAVIHSHLSTVKLLLSNGADPDLEDDDGNTCLHHADITSTDILLELLNSGCNVNKVNSNGDTPLLRAIKDRNRSSTMVLLESGADVNVVNKKGYSSLHSAVLSGLDDVVLELISLGSKLEERSANGDTALLLALQRQQISSSELLMAYDADINAENNQGSSCLHYAAAGGNINLVLEILANTKDINKRNLNGDTALLLALKGNHPGIAKLLTRKGASFDGCNSCQRSCLHYAAELGLDDMIDLLKGMDVNEQDNEGNSPLLLALRQGHVQTAQTLLSNGADVNAKNKQGCSCIHYAAKAGLDSIMLDLLQQGIGVNDQNQDGDTPLLLALRHQHLSIAKLLLAKGADACITNSSNYSCLHYAAQAGDEDVVNKCLQYSPSSNNWFLTRVAKYIYPFHVNGLSTDGNTPLICALESKNLTIANLLMSNGASVVVQNKEGNGCLHYAAIAGYDALIIKLIKDGVDVNRRNKEANTALLLALNHKQLSAAKLLLPRSNVALVNNNGESALHHAASLGDDLLVLSVLNKGAFINQQDHLLGNTPLLIALQHKHATVAELLLYRGADINIRTSYNSNSCLHYAAEGGLDSVLKELLTRGANANNCTQTRGTPLLQALFHKHQSTAQLLLASTSDVEASDERGSTSLHYAAKAGYDEIIVELLGKGADVDRRNDNGETALLCALEHNQISSANLLLAHGASADASAKFLFNFSCLHHAAWNGQDDIIPKLISRGADVNKMDVWGQTPLLLALQFQHVSTAKLLLSISSVFQQRYRFDNSLLHYAAWYGCYEILQELSGIDVDVRNRFDQTPLHYTVWQQEFGKFDSQSQIRTVDYLLARGANVNAQDKAGNTVLHHVSKNCCQEKRGFYNAVAVLFLKQGADVNLPNKYGISALNLAIDHENSEIIELMQQDQTEGQGIKEEEL